jgi:hypothetical protein
LDHQDIQADQKALVDEFRLNEPELAEALDVFGMTDKAYQEAMSEWLDPGTHITNQTNLTRA